MTLFVHRHVFGDTDIKNVSRAASDFIVKRRLAGGSQAWTLVDKETPLFNIAQQALEEEKMSLHCVFTLELHAVLWKSLPWRRLIGAFDVITL